MTQQPPPEKLAIWQRLLNGDGARLAGAAAAGEILLSPRTVAARALDALSLERRSLALKGKEEPYEAIAIRP